MAKLGYYGYNMKNKDTQTATLKDLNSLKVFNKENIGKIWRCLWNG